MREISAARALRCADFGFAHKGAFDEDFDDDEYDDIDPVLTEPPIASWWRILQLQGEAHERREKALQASAG